MQDSWIFVALAFLVGALAGLGLAAWQRSRLRGNDQDVLALREELEEYREEVTAHFVQTAELINDLTQSYKAVYDHLERGAYRLVGEERLRRELEAVDTEPVMLEYLGKPTPAGKPRETAADAPESDED